ncbi:hypothetical protein [uncultured Marinobacter sp.]|uniref:hypothetical protein n=1 Tax=uncultured Marinobacter sp. TaxID=187379 RepID=UPI0030DDC4CB
MLMDPATAEQVGELAALHATGVLVIDLFRMGLLFQAGGLEQTGHFVIVVVRGFPIDHQGKTFFKAQFSVGGRLRQLLFQAFGHADKLQAA